MIEPERPYAGLSIAHEFINLATPDSWTKFNLAMSQGFGDMWVKQGIDWLDYEFFQQENEWNPVIEEENWNETHSSFRPNISYREGMTERQAMTLAEAHDRNEFFGYWFKNVGAWDGYRIGGYLVGSLPDPINFIPLGGGISHLVRAGNAGYKAMKSMRFGGLIAEPSRIVGRMSQEGIEASIYAGLATSVIYHKKNVFEEEYGFSDIGMDMAFAFGAGFAIGNFARAGRTFKEWSAGRQQGRIIEEANRLAGNDPQGGPDPDGPLPSPEDMPMQEPSQRTTAEEMQRINEQTQSYDQQANNELNVENVLDSVRQDPTYNLVVDNVVDTLDKLGDRFYDFVDLVTNCINGKGLGGKK